MWGWWGQNERDRKRWLISLREHGADGERTGWKAGKILTVKRRGSKKKCKIEDKQE